MTRFWMTRWWRRRRPTQWWSPSTATLLARWPPPLKWKTVCWHWGTILFLDGSLSTSTLDPPYAQYVCQGHILQPTEWRMQALLVFSNQCLKLLVRFVLAEYTWDSSTHSLSLSNNMSDYIQSDVFITTCAVVHTVTLSSVLHRHTRTQLPSTHSLCSSVQSWCGTFHQTASP